MSDKETSIQLIQLTERDSIAGVLKGRIQFYPLQTKVNKALFKHLTDVVFLAESDLDFFSVLCESHWWEWEVAQKQSVPYGGIGNWYRELLSNQS